jgi:hypothetical protein
VTTITLPRPEDSLAAECRSVHPIVIQRVDGLMTAHMASFDAVRAALPTRALHPVGLLNWRALISVALYRPGGGLRWTRDVQATFGVLDRRPFDRSGIPDPR